MRMCVHVCVQIRVSLSVRKCETSHTCPATSCQTHASKTCQDGLCYVSGWLTLQRVRMAYATCQDGLRYNVSGWLMLQRVRMAYATTCQDGLCYNVSGWHMLQRVRMAYATTCQDGICYNVSGWLMLQRIRMAYEVASPLPPWLRPSCALLLARLARPLPQIPVGKPHNVMPADQFWRRFLVEQKERACHSTLIAICHSTFNATCHSTFITKYATPPLLQHATPPVM